MPSVQQHRRGAVSKPARAQASPPPARVLEFLERHCRAIALASVLLASVRIAATYTVFSHTSDEPGHIAVGTEFLEKHVYTYEAQHPPLARVAAALGPYLIGARTQPARAPRSEPNLRTREGTEILYVTHRYDLALALARLGILPFFWLGCLVVYQWGKRDFGTPVAATAVFLFSFLPAILAHSGLATTDMAVTACMGVAFLPGLLWLERPTLRLAVLFGVAAALMVLSKFSCFAFFPVSAALVLAWYWIRERPSWRELASEAGRGLPTFGLAVLVACVVIWAGYGFSVGKVDFTRLRLPAPALFAGIEEVAEHNAKGHPGYLLGQRTTTGFWYYYPVAIAFKTPIAFLILLGVGTAMAFTRRSRFQRVWIPLAYAGGIVGVGLFSHINIGIRHILPAFVGFVLVAAAGAVRWLEWGRAKKWRLGALGVLIVWFAASSLLSHPDYLAYFNELAGDQPEKILVDSDLDWGQDVKRLSRRLHELGVTEITFVTNIIADFEGQHGFPARTKRMDVIHPNPGWTALSITAWKTSRLGLQDAYPNIQIWPDLVPPVERVGKGIMLWYIPSEMVKQFQ